MLSGSCAGRIYNISCGMKAVCDCVLEKYFVCLSSGSLTTVASERPQQDFWLPVHSDDLLHTKDVCGRGDK